MVRTHMCKCKRSFFTLEKLNLHKTLYCKKQEHNYYCYNCGKLYKNQRTLENHIKLCQDQLKNVNLEEISLDELNEKIKTYKQFDKIFSKLNTILLKYNKQEIEINKKKAKIADKMKGIHRKFCIKRI